MPRSRSRPTKQRSRPVKRPRERTRRVKVHRRRLEKLGVPAEKVAKMNTMDLRKALMKVQKGKRQPGSV